MAGVRVIGFGNLDAGDDALGVLAVRSAAARLHDLGAEVIAHGAPLAAVHLLEDVDAAVLVDAIRSVDGSRPVGTLVRAVADRASLPSTFRSSLSSHGLGIAEVVALSATLGHEPRIVVLGLEADVSRVGDGLSPAVEAALPSLAAAIVDEMRALR
jgi:hydrogenase maturation protease